MPHPRQRLEPVRRRRSCASECNTVAFSCARAAKITLGDYFYVEGIVLGLAGVLVGSEGVLAGALASASLEPPASALGQEGGQGGLADRADEGRRFVRYYASGGNDLIGGGVQQHGEADAPYWEVRPGCDDVGGDAHQSLVGG
jgi:hypothetical protein